MTAPSPLKGYLCVIAAAILWGAMGTAAKALLQTGVGPFEFVQLRITLAALIVGIALCLGNRRLLVIRLRDVPYFLLLGAGVMAMVQAAYLYAIGKILVGAAVILQFTAPVMVTIYSMCFWQERFTILKVAVLALAIGGCFLVAEGYSMHLLQMNKLGILAALAAAVLLAAYTLLSERALHRYSPWTVLFYSQFFAALTWHVLYPPFAYVHSSYSAFQWALILYVAVCGTVLTFALFLTGISHIRSTRASITGTLEPITAALLTYAALGEKMSWPQVVGASCVVVAIIMLQFERERIELTPQAIRNRWTEYDSARSKKLSDPDLV